MAFEKCPRCELNYILDGGKLCTVCRKEVCGEGEHDDLPEMCSECGENPAVPGGELCIACLKESGRRGPTTAAEDDELLPEEASLGIDSMSDMEEIELELPDDDIVAEVFEGEDAFGDDEEERDEIDEEENLLDEDDYGDDDFRDR